MGEVGTRHLQKSAEVIEETFHDSRSGDFNSLDFMICVDKAARENLEALQEASGWQHLCQFAGLSAEICLEIADESCSRLADEQPRHRNPDLIPKIQDRFT